VGFWLDIGIQGVVIEAKIGFDGSVFVTTPSEYFLLWMAKRITVVDLLLIVLLSCVYLCYLLCIVLLCVLLSYIP